MSLPRPITLLTFAHPAEAKTFISELGLVKKTHNLYGPGENSEANPDLYLLITGEGIEQALSETSFYLGQFSEHEVNIINLGVCGLLRQTHKNHKLGDIVHVRTLYAQKRTNEVQFKSYSLKSDEQIDLITTHDRILDEKQRNYLSQFADLVDREAWALGLCAQKFGANLQCYKLLSDYASGEVCEIVKEDATMWSDSLYRYYQKNISHKNIEQIEINTFELPPQFYVTVSQQRKLLSIVKSLSLKGHKQDELFKIIAIEQIIELKIRPKERTKLLIDRLNELLNPLSEALEEKRKKLWAPFVRAGIKVSFDRDLEVENLTLNANFKNEQERLRIIHALQEFKLTSWHKLLRGEDV